MENTITVYSLSTCTSCRAVKRLLDASKVKYQTVEVDLEENDARQGHMQRLRELNPRCSFPTTVIGEAVIIGNKQEEIAQLLGIAPPPNKGFWGRLFS